MSQDQFVRDRVAALQKAIIQDKLNGNFENRQFIVKCLVDVTTTMSESYDSYRKPVPRVLYVLEWLKMSLLPYAMPLLEIMSNDVLNNLDVVKEDLKIMDELVDDEASTLFYKLLGSSLSINNRVEMETFQLDISGLSVGQLRKVLSLILKLLQHNTESIEWDQEIVENMFLNVAAGRYLAKELGELDIFYFSMGMFLDRLHISQRQQHARDMSENFLLCSFIDCVPEWGFFLEFKVFSAQGDISASILYALLSLDTTLKKGFINEILIKEIVWQFMKFYRNVNLSDIAIEFYHNIPKNINFGPYKNRALKQTLFSCMLSKHNQNLPEIVLDYLNQEREEIFSGGMHDCLPWLVLLYNMRKLYDEADYSPVGLGFYVEVFEQIVPKEMIAPFKKLLVESEGDPAILIDDLKVSIMKLSETRSLSDYSYDNEMAIKISQKIVMSDNIEGYLLSMMIKSDFGLFFNEKHGIDKYVFVFSDANPNNFYKYFSDQMLISSIKIFESYDMVWLAMGERFVRQCILFENSFRIHSLEKWQYSSFKKVKEEIKPLLIHEVTKKVRGQVQMLLEEDYEDQVKHLKLCLDNIRVMTNDSKALLLVKDMQLSDFPHNLILNQNGDFVFIEKPIANVLSTDRVLDSVNKEISASFSSGIWIPTEAGDLAINRLYDNIEITLNNFNFNIYTNMPILTPLSCDLNIIVGHGADDISKFNVIYPGGENAIFDLDKIVKSGEIIILFICHSGSMEKDSFQNQISTLIKIFLDLGCKSIIAPFWALSIDVPPIWLPVFMHELMTGSLIIDCIWKANMAVRESYPNSTPATWACLHLYGSPFLKIK